MPLSDRQWKNLARDLQQQRCVLFLGSRLLAAPGSDATMNERLAVHLAGILDQEGISYEKDAAQRLHYIAQRFLAIPKIRRIDLEDEVLEFYRQHPPVIPDLYHRLARLPFTLIINTAPDELMLRALLQAGKTGARGLHYNLHREREAAVLQEFSPEQPLVYNLWGTLSDPESLVLSQEDRVEFIKNVVKGNPAIPNQVMSCFDERKTYLFLGFNLENWDVRLLLDCFKLSRENTTLSPQLDNYPMRPETKSFFEDRYQFLFVSQAIGQFVDDVGEQFDRQQPAEPQAPVADARRLVVLYHANETDRDCLLRLRAQLNPWIQNGRLQLWDPGSALHGDVGQQMLEQIAAADAVMPVLSADFLADPDQIPLIEQALQQHRERGLRIVPLLYRACTWEDTALRDFPPLPERDKPLRNWPDTDTAFTLVAERLKTLLNYG
ncbi:MAG: toll/interleukin-1 receptor domain-containing protein [Lewinellaceae bacterium]|nr:toll/interleukin-1 receptor domain-containing protein [Lewinellaceae bacterium]MCB9355250.1 toll/interleukin-1 receptor domain-containing protein [Lewinellaceae bacterium]